MMAKSELMEQHNSIAVTSGTPPAAASRSTVREINRKVVMDVISRNDGICRAELAKVLGLSKPAVADCVTDLISMGFVEERHTGAASNGGGRPPIMLHFNGLRSFIGVIDLSHQEPFCGVGDLNYQLIGLKKILIDEESSSSAKRQCFIDTLDEILSSKNIPNKKMECIVISTPGIIGKDNMSTFTGERHHAWTEIDLKPHLEKYYGIPVLQENDAKLSALGEVNLSIEKLEEDIIYVKCGVGIGAGIILGGKIYYGNHRSAGELGSFITNYGRRVGDVTDMEGLLQHIQELSQQAGRVKSNLSFENIVKMVKDGDSVATQGVRYIGQELGRAIYNASIIFDIPTVIVGGDYLKLGDVLFDAINEGMPQTFLTRPKIYRSTLKESGGIFGGLVLGKKEIFMQKQLLSG
jgi:predicted NBD/HSP70 family sugar kinase